MKARRRRRRTSARPGNSPKAPAASAATPAAPRRLDWPPPYIAKLARRSSIEPITWRAGQDEELILAGIWLASGPGRAWRADQWAKGVTGGEKRLQLARNVINQVEQIRALYKAGGVEQANRANILVERVERMVERADLLVRFERREAIRSINRKNASAPRNLVRKANLITFRDGHQKKHGRLRGWKKAACLELKLSLKTLNSRMA